MSGGGTSTARPLLRAEGLTKVFGSGRTEVVAVDGIDLASDRGEVTLVMGPSGSGKTTLLTMLGCLLRTAAERIVIDGLDVTALPAKELSKVRRSLVGFVFQTFNLLEEAGLEGRLDFPARGLSAGERQRVAIARALANDPPLLLADEPTANLDSHHGHKVMELLRTLAKGHGSGAIVVSHDERLREIADRVIWIEDGRVTDAPRLPPLCGFPLDPLRRTVDAP